MEHANVPRMAATRVLRDGTKAIASTIYLKKPTDDKAVAKARELSKSRNRKVSKSKVLVETLETHL